MKRWLADMTWPEVAHAVASGATTVILPLGATEQHGPHLPVGTDTYLAAAQAERLAATLADALIAPALPVGCSDEHSGFAGLLSLDHDTLARVVIDCAKRIAAWGIRRLVIVSAHGGNGQALQQAAARLADEVPRLQVCVCGSSTTVCDALLAIAEADGISPEAVGLHAGEGETSQMLCLHPDLVHMDRVVPGYIGSITEVMPKLLDAGLRPLTPTGTLGDARLADAGRGERYLAEQIDGYGRSLTPLPDAPPVPVPGEAQCA
jgi:mycofactocin system creatininase family protein